MDLTETIQVNSDQLNADDLIGGPITITITAVTEGNQEQPVYIHAKELHGKTYRPSKSMRRVLVAVWGGDGNTYAGRRLTLYRNPDIRFGKEKVGGIEVSHASHIGAPVTTSIPVARGKRKQHSVQPLPDPTPAITVADVEACDDVNQLRAWWQTATDDVKEAITARAKALTDLQAAAEQDSELVQGELIEEQE